MSDCTHEHASITFTEDGTKYHVCKGCSAYLSDNELSLWVRINALCKQLTTLKEKARAAVNAPYDDVLDMGLAQALRELGEVL